MRRLLYLAAGVLMVAACGLTPVENRPPVPAGPLGPIVPGPAGAPPVECRGVPIEQCTSFANAGEVDVVRYIVTCTTVCTPLKGDVRIDVLGSDGTVRNHGDGGYEAAAAAPVPEPAPTASDPGPS